MAGFYDIENYNDLYLKCKYDYALLESTKGYIEYSYDLLNLIFSLNHLYEWYIKDKDIPNEKRDICIETFFPYENGESIGIKEVENYLKERKLETNTKQFLIRKVCNNTKHFLRRDNDPDQKMQKNFTACAGSGVYAGTGRCAGEYDKYNYYLEHNDQKYDLLEILDKLMAEWEEFLAEEEIRRVEGG